jgi:chaperonin GroES
MNLLPCGDRILVQRTDANEKMVGNIVIPVQKRSNTARVVAISDDGGNFEIGDIVLIADTAGVPFEFDGENYLVLRPQEVLVRVGE